APVVRPPAFLTRNFGSHENPLTRAERRKPVWSASVAKGLGRFFRIWRGHIQREITGVRRDRRRRRAAGGVAGVLLTLLVLVMCAGTVIAITHFRSLKTEIAALERELASLKQQAAKPASAEKRVETSRTVETRDQLDARIAEKNSAGPQNIPAPGALILS